MVFEVQDDRIPFYTQYISLAIVIINIIVFIIQFFDPTGNMFIYEAAFIPREFFAGKKVWTLITAMFMHANILHIFFNMWFFYVVADNCEKAMGHIYFLITYLVSGICAGLLHAFMMLLVPPMLDVPTLGASGAIMGIIAVYGILFPKNQLRLFISLIPVRLSARTFVILYFFIELIYGFIAIGDGTAHFAHVGGFIAGAFFAGIFKLWSKEY